jgi:MFS family permease
MRPFKASNIVLGLLCAMYFITYVDRVNVGTAAGAFQEEFGLTNLQLGYIFSAFAYPYLLLQIGGAWVGDHFGPRRILFACGIIWAGATIFTGLAWGFWSLFIMRLFLGLGEGATFPTATRAMRSWIAPARYGFAQGITHSFSRLGNAVTPPIVAFLIVYLSWRGSFVVLGLLSLIWVTIWVWYFRDDPRDHPSITEEEIAQLPAQEAGGPKERPRVPWWALVCRIWPVTLTYFCYGWSLWLYLNWIPLFFLNNHGLNIRDTAIFAAGVFLAGVVGDTVGGIVSDRIYKRTGNVKVARLSVIVFGFVGALVSLAPLLFTRDITVVALSLSGGFFFVELIIGPIWAVPMDIAPKFASTAAGLMNVGSASAAILSPIAAGFIIDVTGNWELPFFVLMGFLVLGAVMAFTMHPERPFVEPGERASA